MSTTGNGNDILLQGFHWNLTKTQGTGTFDNKSLSWYTELTRLAPKISADGFTMIYLPPPWSDDSEWYGHGKHGGGEGYYWHDFDLNSRYGSKEELKLLVAEMHRHGVKVIIDIVINHRDRTRMQKDIWPYPGEAWRTAGDDSGGRFMDGSADLNLTNPTVYTRIQQALSELQTDVGVDGWRWDFVWGFDPQEVRSLILDTKHAEYFSVGEYWQDRAHGDDPMAERYGANEKLRILGWMRESGSAVFDICLKRAINTGVASNLSRGINTSVAPVERSSVVTFVDNHDTGASPECQANNFGQRAWECSPDFKSRAYAFILSMPGLPMVYWPDLYDWNVPGILELIRARKLADITAASEYTDLSSSYGGFAAIVRNQRGEDALAIAIDSAFVAPPGFTLFAKHENEWAVYLKS